MDLKVGMHAYSKKCRDYGIGKIVNITKRGQGFYGDLVDIQYKYSTHSIKHQEIVASYNIIDLIEAGDFITYNKNNINICDPKRVYSSYNEETGETELKVDDEILLNEIDIKSIVTHDEFDAMKYEVK